MTPYLAPRRRSLWLSVWAAGVWMGMSACTGLAATTAVINLVSEGNGLYCERNYAGAKAKYLAAIAADATYATAHSNLALAHARLGEFADAIAAAQQATVLEPTDKRHWLDIGKVSAMNGQNAEAIAAFSTATEKDANYAKAYYNRGWCYDARNAPGDAASAIADYQQAIALDGSYWAAMLALAVTEAKAGAMEEAVWWCKRAIAGTCGGGSASALNVLARQDLRTMRGDDFEFQAEASTSGFRDALADLVHHRTSSAVVAFQQLVQAEPNSALAHFMYGRALGEANPSDPAAGAQFSAARALLPEGTFASTPSATPLYLDFYPDGSTTVSDRLFPALYDVVLKSLPQVRSTTSTVTKAGPNSFSYVVADGSQLDLSRIVEGTITDPKFPNCLERSHTLRIHLGKLLGALRLREFLIATRPELQRYHVDIFSETGFYSGDEGSFTGTLTTASAHVNITRSSASSQTGDEYFELVPQESLATNPELVAFTLAWATPLGDGAFTFQIDPDPDRDGIDDYGEYIGGTSRRGARAAWERLQFAQLPQPRKDFLCRHHESHRRDACATNPPPFQGGGRGRVGLR